jgi:hypothetical protein
METAVAVFRALTLQNTGSENVAVLYNQSHRSVLMVVK